MLRRKQPADSRAPDTAPDGFRAVGVECYGRACEAARSLVDQRFLSREAPRLPLRDCTAAACECRYTHHGDRRDEERRSPFFSRGIGLGTTRDERRLRFERRVPDKGTHALS